MELFMRNLTISSASTNPGQLVASTNTVRSPRTLFVASRTQFVASTNTVRSLRILFVAVRTLPNMVRGSTNTVRGSSDTPRTWFVGLPTRFACMHACIHPCCWFHPQPSLLFALYVTIRWSGVVWHAHCVYVWCVRCVWHHITPPQHTHVWHVWHVCTRVPHHVHCWLGTNPGVWSSECSWAAWHASDIRDQWSSRNWWPHASACDHQNVGMLIILWQSLITNARSRAARTKKEGSQQSLITNARRRINHPGMLEHVRTPQAMQAECWQFEHSSSQGHYFLKMLAIQITSRSLIFENADSSSIGHSRSMKVLQVLQS